MPNDSTPKSNSIPYGYCHCGCGEKTSLATKTNTARGVRKGEPVRYVSGHNQRGKPGHWRGKSGEEMPNFGKPSPMKGKPNHKRRGTPAWNKGIATGTAWNRGLVSEENRLAGLGIITDERKRRFFEKVQMPAETDPDGCWLWKAAMQSGYGVFGTYRRYTMLAHRFSYIMHGGEIPEGWHLHHLCNTPACVNPDHLQPVSPGDHTKLHWDSGSFEERVAAQRLGEG